MLVFFVKPLLVKPITKALLKVIVYHTLLVENSNQDGNYIFESIYAIISFSISNVA